MVIEDSVDISVGLQSSSPNVAQTDMAVEDFQDPAQRGNVTNWKELPNLILPSLQRDEEGCVAVKESLAAVFSSVQEARERQ